MASVNFAIDHDPELEWFLCASAATLGERSAFAAQVAAIERGGGGSGSPETWPTATAGAIESRQGRRWSRLSRAWHQTDHKHRRVLLAHYLGSMPTQSSNGSRTRWPRGVEAQLGRFAGVAVLLAYDAGKLAEVLTACASCKPSKLTGVATDAAEACKAAHTAYRAALRTVAQAWAEGEA